MKYLIEVPDETGQAYYNIAPYTEPSQKAIDLQHAHDIENVARMNYSKGAEDAWEFARRIICPSDCCEDSISSHMKEIFNKDGWEIRGIFNDLSYQEARDKYDAWKKQKDEIRVGDEVTSKFGDGVVIDIVADESVHILGKDGHWNEYADGEYCKTGRHFDEVEKLMKRMREE